MIFVFSLSNLLDSVWHGDLASFMTATSDRTCTPQFFQTPNGPPHHHVRHCNALQWPCKAFAFTGLLSTYHGLRIKSGIPPAWCAWDNANGSFGITFFSLHLCSSLTELCAFSWHFLYPCLACPQVSPSQETPAPIRPHSCLWLDIWAAVPHQAVICLLFCTFCSLYTSQFWLLSH